MSEDNKNPGAESPNNLCIIFGPRPQKAINNDSKTIRHFIELIAKGQDDQRSVSFPDLINVMKEQRPSLEYIINKGTQRLQLYHRSSIYRPVYQNNTTDSIGIVFVNRGGDARPDLVYNPWDAALVDTSIQQTKDFFASLNISNPEVVENPSRDEVVAKFKQLLQYAIQYGREGLVIIVRWIGINIRGKYKIKVKAAPNQTIEEASKLSRYALTGAGEAVNVDAYCLKLANTAGTHVMLLQDWDPTMYDKAHAWAEKVQGMSAVSGEVYA